MDNNYTELLLSQLELNEGQLPGLPANPRDIIQEKFELLKKNLLDYPEMLKLRGLLVYPLSKSSHYIIIGGNMRYRAMKELDIETAPCVVIPAETPVENLKAYTILDNNGFGRWDWDMLADEWDTDELNALSIDLPLTGDIIDNDNFFNNQSGDAETTDKKDTLTVIIPSDFSDQKGEIKNRIEEAICADYQGIRVK